MLLVVGMLAFAAGCGGDDDEASGGTTAEASGAEGGTLVFAGAADPVLLDGALVSDGESLRVITQIFETLVALKPGTTEPEPGLAESWSANDDGTVWTFKIREGVKFHDGTDLDAEAVCYNFDRWYNFKGALAEPGAPATTGRSCSAASRRTTRRAAPRRKASTRVVRRRTRRRPC